MMVTCELTNLYLCDLLLQMHETRMTGQITRVVAGQAACARAEQGVST